MQRASKWGWAWRGHSQSHGPSALLWLRPPQGLVPQDRPRASGWLGRSSWAPVTVRMTPRGSPLLPPLLSLPQQSKESDTTHPLAPPPLVPASVAWPRSGPVPRAGSRTCSTGRACLSARLQVDGAGRWAATCSVLPSDSRELPGCYGALFFLFLRTPSHAGVGQLLGILFIWEELRLGNGVRKGEGA